MPLLDPNKILVPENRQRKTAADIDGLAKSISRIGQIHPIVVRRENGEIRLVVGESRLRACRQLNKEIEARFWDELSVNDARIIELEENIKRSDLPWREHVGAILEIHGIYTKKDPPWTVDSIADYLSITSPHLSMILTVGRNLGTPALRDATGLRQAYSILQIAADRRAAAIVGDIAHAGKTIFETPNGNGASNDSVPTNGPTSPTSESSIPTEEPAISDSTIVLPSKAASFSGPPIIEANFLDWIGNYSGPKFTFIHCDFPYDIKYDSYAKSVTATSDDYDFSGFWPLLSALCNNLDRISSYSSHVMFWFSMKFYERTKICLEKSGLYVHDHPFIWFKSDNSGIIPGRDAIFPRRVYETAFLCSRGRRPLVKSLSNLYSAPMTSNPIHPSQKPEPVLHHFFSMLVDETTDMLDPTCGSGTAIRAAEFVGARSALGLELNPEYAKAALVATENFRAMRRINR